MPLVPAPTLRLVFFWRDGSEATVWRFTSLPGASLADAMSFAITVAGLLTNVSNCALYKIHILYSVEETNKPTARSGTIIGNLNIAGIFVFNTENENLYTFNVPAIKEAMITTPPDPLAGITINQSNLDIAALISAMISGIGGVRPVAPWDSGDANELDWTGELLESIEVCYRGYEEY